MAEIIKLKQDIKRLTDAELTLQGKIIFQNLDAEAAQSLVSMFLSVLRLEAQIHFGCADLTDDQLDAYERSLFFDAAKDEIKKCTDGCYFCDLNIDPNGVEFTNETTLCPRCQFKMGNFLTFIGLDPKKFLSLVVVDRKVQNETLSGKVGF